MRNLHEGHGQRRQSETCVYSMVASSYRPRNLGRTRGTKQNPTMTLIYFTLAWVTGILFAAHGLQLPFWPGAALVGGSIGAALLLRKHHTQRLLALCVALGLLGMLRMQAVAAPPPPDAVSHLNGSGWVQIEGIVSAEPDIRDTHTNLRVSATLFLERNSPRELTGLVLVQAPRIGEYAYGDRVLVSGLLLTPPEFDTFSYRDYLARQGIRSWMPNARVQVLEHGAGNPLIQSLLRVKQRAHQIIVSALPEPQASLLAGILLGLERGIAPEVRDAFNATGSSHVIAISGFNMTLIAGLVNRLLMLFWPRRRRMTTLLSLIAVGVYTVFVGADAAVLRAALMSGLLLCAPLLRRRVFLPASLAFAALAMSAHDPFVLWDIGFQLSFAAVLGLGLFVQPIESGIRAMLRRWLARDRVEFTLRLISEPIIVTTAAQITTLPLIMLYFGRVSLSAFIVNLLILPAQTPLLILGGAATLLGMVSPVIAQPLYWASWLFLSWTIAVVRFFAALPGSSVEIRLSSLPVILFFMALLMTTILNATQPGWLKQSMPVLRRRFLQMGITAAAGIAALVLLLGAAALPDGTLHVHFLAMGDANSVLIETPEGIQILIDGGEYPSRLLTALGDRMPFWDRHIELLILTQPRQAQMAALPAVLERYSVGQVLTNGVRTDHEVVSALYNHFDTAAIPVTSVYAGYRIETSDGVTLEALHPAPYPSPESHPDDSALILRLIYGETAFVLMPHISPEAEAALLAQTADLRSTVLQVPTNGDPDVTSSDLLAAVQPEYAVVQVAPGNYRGYPSEEVTSRLGNAPLFRVLYPFRLK